MILPTGSGIDRNGLRLGRWFAAMAAVIALAGCGPSDPLERKVIADNSRSPFGCGEGRRPRDLAPARLADFEQAVQEFRFHIMAEGSVHGSDAVEDATLLLIDRQTVRHVMQQGLGWELERAEAERAQLEDSLKKNALMTTRLGDTASANYLADLRDRQVTDLAPAPGQKIPRPDRRGHGPRGQMKLPRITTP